ncbi:MAG: carboxypeptidase-like regulatory domain-containing protein [Mucilaginibacter sp.]
MKKMILAIATFIMALPAIAQTTTITGTVRNPQGDPLHFAFVQNDQKQGAFTDSLGNFSIAAATNSMLHVNCAGYRDTSVVVTGQQNVNITLFEAVSISAKVSSVAGAANQANTANVKSTMGDEITLQSSVSSNAFDAARGAMLPVFNPKEETQGSRYLLKGWVHGFVVNTKGETVQDPHFMFAYDKMGGGLLITKDKQSAIEIDRSLVKSFTLYDNADNVYTFENMPLIDKFHYVQLISTGNKYKIYKAIKTTFEKANYTTDGVMSDGHNYDLYTDNATYYVLNMQTNALKKIDLKRKAIKETFAADASRLNKFMSDHSSDDIDDNYLAGLGAYMNE